MKGAEQMTTKELYETVGGDYEKMIENVKTDERIVRFARMFIEDDIFLELEKAMEEKNYEMAFQAAHKLKGVSKNMFFERMFQIVFDLTEALRNQSDIPGAEQLFLKLRDIHELTADCIKKLD